MAQLSCSFATNCRTKCYFSAISRYASNIEHNLVWDSDLRVRKCQYLPHKNRRRKVERERWIRRWQKESKTYGGESSWWQGDCKPNRTHTLIAIFAESAMNKEKGREERLSKHQFSLLVICDCHELYIIWLLGIRMYCRGSHINRGGRSSLWFWNCDKFIAQTNWHSLEHLRVSLGSSH